MACSPAIPMGPTTSLEPFSAAVWRHDASSRWRHDEEEGWSEALPAVVPLRAEPQRCEARNLGEGLILCLYKWDSSAG